MPHIILTIVYPKILEVLSLLRGVLKPTEEENIVLFSTLFTCFRDLDRSKNLEVGHPMAASGRRPLAFIFKPSPFSCGWL